jgi:hypothetical protein
MLHRKAARWRMPAMGQKLTSHNPSDEVSSTLKSGHSKSNITRILPPSMKGNIPRFGHYLPKAFGVVLEALH